ncbi:MAG: hypothetical protein BWX80_02547 [Candidatus Hydrogenedentes bacterium ADurb.Bin101]|nr:MAG: hypothetical protein BWX80_02547 [Candidatus Hydrogenedentes bacterium ADurb.Bin101]
MSKKRTDCEIALNSPPNLVPEFLFGNLLCMDHR